MRNLRLLVACTAIFSLTWLVSCGDDDGGNPTETNCTDGQDNDGDMLTDCADPDCAQTVACTGCNNNSVCEPARGETAANCNDCVTTNPCNNNGTCDTAAGETQANCPADCTTTNPCTNNGTCDTAAGETAANCPADCSGGGQCTTTTDLIEQNGCPGQSCTVVDQQGTIGCGPTGTNANYADCSNQQGCLAGALCAGDGTSSNCMPFCDINNPSCPTGGVCMFQIATSDGNVGLCGAGDNCDPGAQSGCGTGEACYLVTQAGDTLCSAPGTGAAGTSCQYIDDCAGGLQCVGNPGSCMVLCDGSHPCTTGTCQDLGVTAWPGLGVCQ